MLIPGAELVLPSGTRTILPGRAFIKFPLVIGAVDVTEETFGTALVDVHTSEEQGAAIAVDVVGADDGA